MNIQMYKERIRELKWRKTCSCNERKGKEGKEEERKGSAKPGEEDEVIGGEKGGKEISKNEYRAEEVLWSKENKNKKQKRKKNSRESGASFVFSPWWMTVLTKRAKLEAFSCNSVEILLTRSNFSETYDSAAHNDLGYWFGSRGAAVFLYWEGGGGACQMVCCIAGLRYRLSL